MCIWVGSGCKRRQQAKQYDPRAQQPEMVRNGVGRAQNLAVPRHGESQRWAWGDVQGEVCAQVRGRPSAGHRCERCESGHGESQRWAWGDRRRAGPEVCAQDAQVGGGPSAVPGLVQVTGVSGVRAEVGASASRATPPCPRSINA